MLQQTLCSLICLLWRMKKKSFLFGKKKNQTIFKNENGTSFSRRELYEAIYVTLLILLTGMATTMGITSRPEFRSCGGIFGMCLHVYPPIQPWVRPYSNLK